MLAEQGVGAEFSQRVLEFLIGDDGMSFRPCPSVVDEKRNIAVITQQFFNLGEIKIKSVS